jgi:hypothetical protein
LRNRGKENNLINIEAEEKVFQFADEKFRLAEFFAFLFVDASRKLILKGLESK